MVLEAILDLTWIPAELNSFPLSRRIVVQKMIQSSFTESVLDLNSEKILSLEDRDLHTSPDPSMVVVTRQRKDTIGSPCVQSPISGDGTDRQHGHGDDEVGNQ